MPKQANQIYHVVSMEWFKNWQKFVGIEEEKKEEPEGQSENLQVPSQQDEARNQFKKLTRGGSKGRKVSPQVSS